jgi:hypothetical protein
MPDHGHGQQQAGQDGEAKGGHANAGVEAVGHEVGEVIRPEGLQSAQSGPPDREAQGASGQREHEGFGEEKPRDLASPGAQDLPDRKFLVARARAHEEKVGEVDGADQKEKRHARLEQEQAGPGLGDEILVQVHDLG